MPGESGSYIASGNAIIRYYYKTDPDKLSNKEWGERIAEWQFIQEYEDKRQEALLSHVFKSSLYQVANDYLKATRKK